MRLLLLISMAGVALACGSRQLPAAQAPDQTLPVLLGPPPPLAAGTGRVVLDITDGPARIERVTGRTSGRVDQGPGWAWTPAGFTPIVPLGSSAYRGETRELLCQSPCAVDLPYGVHPIVVTTRDGRVNAMDLAVAAEPVVLRVVMTSETRHGVLRGFGVVGTAIGVGALIAGGVLIGMTAAHDEGSGRTVMFGSAIALMVGGVGLSILGIHLLDRSRPEVRPGAMTQFALPKDAYAR